MEDNKFTRKVTQDNFVTEKIDIIENKLLGTYDDNGNYGIAPQIVSELILLKKHRKSSYGNSMFCVGNLFGYGEIVFEVCYDKSVDENINAKAKLYVLEDVDKVNGYIQNTIKTFIAEFSSNVNNFIEESYTKFNITNESDDKDEEGKEKKELSDLELDDSYILAKKAYMLLLDKLENEKLLDAYGKLFTEKLSTLTKLDNEFAKDVLDKFNGQYESIEDLFLKEKNYKDLNELLDSCIEQVSGTNQLYVAQENDFNSKISTTLETFTDNVNDLNEKSEKKALNMLDKSDREKLEEMIDSQINSSENLSDVDSGDGEAEIEVPRESFQTVEEGNRVSYVLDNPILYDEIEEENEGETEQAEVATSEEIVMTPITPQVVQEPIANDITLQDQMSEMTEEENPQSQDPTLAEPQESEEEIENQAHSIEDIINSVKNKGKSEQTEITEKQTETEVAEERNNEEGTSNNYRRESAEQIKNGIDQIIGLDTQRKEVDVTEQPKIDETQNEAMQPQEDSQKSEEQQTDKHTEKLNSRMNDLRRHIESKQRQQIFNETLIQETPQQETNDEVKIEITGSNSFGNVFDSFNDGTHLQSEEYSVANTSETSRTEEFSLFNVSDEELTSDGDVTDGTNLTVDGFVSTETQTNPQEQNENQSEVQDFTNVREQAEEMQYTRNFSQNTSGRVM